jgi:hypothetical protein
MDDPKDEIIVKVLENSPVREINRRSRCKGSKSKKRFKAPAPVHRRSHIRSHTELKKKKSIRTPPMRKNGHQATYATATTTKERESKTQLSIESPKQDTTVPTSGKPSTLPQTINFLNHTYELCNGYYVHKEKDVWRVICRLEFA